MEVKHSANIDDELAVRSFNQTQEFRRKAANFVAKNLLSLNVSSVIQCNLLDAVQGCESPEGVCNFCKCDMTNSVHFRLLPQGVPDKKMRKLINRERSTPCRFNALRRVYLTKFEKSLLKKWKARPANIMVKTCSVCQKSTKFPLKPWKQTNTESQSKGDYSGSQQMKHQKAIAKKGKSPHCSTADKMQQNHHTKPVMKQAATQKMKTKPLLSGKGAKSKSTPEFIKKFKKGNKLASLIEQDEASKLAAKKNPKNNIFALLHGWIGK